MKPAGILLAVVPASGGAIAWGLLYAHTYCEFAFLAWVIGAVIGITAASFCSRRVGTAIVCAAFALASIAAGKTCAMKWSAADSFAYYYLEEWLSFEAFKELAEDAKAFAKIDDSDSYPQFMAERRYSRSVVASEVSEAEVADFVEFDKEWLLWMYDERPTYAEWRIEVEDYYAEEAQKLANEDARGMTVVEAGGYAIEYLTEPVDAFFAIVAMGPAALFGYGFLLAPKRA